MDPPVQCGGCGRRVRRPGRVWDLLVHSAAVEVEYRRQIQESGFVGGVADFQVVLQSDLGSHSAEASRVGLLTNPLINTQDEPTWNNYLGVRDHVVRQGTRLAELGCRSPSYFLRDAARHGVECVGLDLYFHTDGRSDSGYVKVLADMCRLPLPDAAFDTIFVSSALHHTPDLAGAVREVHRVLRPGGRFVLASEPPVSLLRRAGVVAGRPGDKARYTYPEYRRALREAGFRRVQIHFPGHVERVITSRGSSRHHALSEVLGALWQMPLGRWVITHLGLPPALLLLEVSLVAVAYK